MYICVFVCTYAYVYVCVSQLESQSKIYDPDHSPFLLFFYAAIFFACCMYTVSMDAYIYVRMYLRTYVYMYICVYMYMHTHLCVNAYVHAGGHIYIYVYMHE